MIKGEPESCNMQMLKALYLASLINKMREMKVEQGSHSLGGLHLQIQFY